MSLKTIIPGEAGGGKAGSQCSDLGYFRGLLWGIGGVHGIHHQARMVEFHALKSIVKIHGFLFNISIYYFVKASL